MQVLDRTALGGREAGKVHEAGHVPADEDVRVRFQNVVELQRSHPAGNVRKCDGKCPAKATTLLGLAEGRDDGVLDGFQQFQCCLTATRATAVTRTMERDACRLIQFTRPCFDAESVVNEVHDLPCPSCQRVDGGVWIFLELERISVKIHRCAGTGGHNDRKLASENRCRVACDFSRSDPVAGVEGRLTAASLIIGKFHGNSEVFENLHGSAGDIVVEGIAKAGAHEEHAFVSRAEELASHGKIGASTVLRSALFW